MAKIKVSELAQLRESDVNKYTSLLVVDNNQSYQLKYGFLSSNLSSNLYRPITETVSVECDIQQQKDDIAALLATSNSLCDEIQLSTQTLISEIDTKIDKTTIATTADLGLIKVGYDTDNNERNYAVQLTEENKAYVHVPWEGGSGGSDPAVDILKSISSYYAGQGTNPTNKVENLSIDFTKISSYVKELSDMNIAGRVDGFDERLDEILTFDDSGEMLSGFIVDLSSNISNLYPVGAVYTTTNNDIPDELKTNGMEWDQINTDLSSVGIRFFKRVQ